MTVSHPIAAIIFSLIISGTSFSATQEESSYPATQQAIRPTEPLYDPATLSGLYAASTGPALYDIPQSSSLDNQYDATTENAVYATFPLYSEGEKAQGYYDVAATDDDTANQYAYQDNFGFSLPYAVVSKKTHGLYDMGESPTDFLYAEAEQDGIPGQIYSSIEPTSGNWNPQMYAIADGRKDEPAIYTAVGSGSNTAWNADLYNIAETSFKSADSASVFMENESQAQTKNALLGLEKKLRVAPLDRLFSSRKRCYSLMGFIEGTWNTAIIESCLVTLGFIAYQGISHQPILDIFTGGNILVHSSGQQALGLLYAIPFFGGAMEAYSRGSMSPDSNKAIDTILNRLEEPQSLRRDIFKGLFASTFRDLTQLLRDPRVKPDKALKALKKIYHFSQHHTAFSWIEAVDSLYAVTNDLSSPDISNVNNMVQRTTAFEYLRQTREDSKGHALKNAYILRLLASLGDTNKKVRGLSFLYGALKTSLQLLILEGAINSIQGSMTPYESASAKTGLVGASAVEPSALPPVAQSTLLPTPSRSASITPATSPTPSAPASSVVSSNSSVIPSATPTPSEPSSSVVIATLQSSSPSAAPVASPTPTPVANSTATPPTTTIKTTASGTTSFHRTLPTFRRRDVGSFPPTAPSEEYGSIATSGAASHGPSLFIFINTVYRFLFDQPSRQPSRPSIVSLEDDFFSLEDGRNITISESFLSPPLVNACAYDAPSYNRCVALREPASRMATQMESGSLSMALITYGARCLLDKTFETMFPEPDFDYYEGAPAAPALISSLQNSIRETRHHLWPLQNPWFYGDTLETIEGTLSHALKSDGKISTAKINDLKADLDALRKDLELESYVAFTKLKAPQKAILQLKHAIFGLDEFLQDLDPQKREPDWFFEITRQRLNHFQNQLSAFEKQPTKKFYERLNGEFELFSKNLQQKLGLNIPVTYASYLHWIDGMKRRLCEIRAERKFEQKKTKLDKFQRTVEDPAYFHCI